MAENTAAKQPRRRGPGRPYEPGQSGNPAGKPKGARNRATLLLEGIEESDLKAIVTTIVKKAKGGDLVAAKMLLDRVLPTPKGRAVPVELQALGEWDGTDALLTAYRTIIAAVSNGHISPAEGLELVALIEAQRAAVKELRPAAMSPEPTPEQLAAEKQANEELGVMFERLRRVL